MKKRLLHIGFLIPLSVFLIHQFLQYGMKVHLPFVDSYLDPFCAGSLALYAVSTERWVFFGQKYLSKTDIIVTTVFLAIVSEILFPYFSDRFTSDWVDVIAILLGSIWYVTFSKQGLRVFRMSFRQSDSKL